MSSASARGLLSTATRPSPLSVALYFDLGSPYAYLAVLPAEVVLGRPPDLEPVLLGAIFGLRGHRSWSQTAERAAVPGRSAK
jgi:2-hydroxychromene-2-carboxylate isomerase